jgi:hypothetical protein
LPDLAATYGGQTPPWSDRAIDVRAAAARAWAFPSATDGVLDMLAQLRAGMARPEAASALLPFVEAETEHPALLYRRYADRADATARAALLGRVDRELAALLDLYDLLRGAA